MSRVDSPHITRITVTFDDGTEWRCESPTDFMFDTKRATEIVPCLDHADCGAVHRRLTGAETHTLVAYNGAAGWLGVTPA